MSGNSGLIGFPSGNRVMDAASAANFGDVAFGDRVHYVNLPVTPDALQTGYRFRYIPVATNPGSVDVYINGMGPFSLCKAIRTDSADVVGTIITLTGGEIHAGGTLECMFRNDTLVEVIAGLNWQPTDFGLNMGNAASPAVGRSVLGLASGATTTVGTAATRNVGTAAGQLVEVVDGSGNLNALLNVANKSMSNLALDGTSKIIWSSIIFNGVTAAVFGQFNMFVAKIGTGRYALSFADMGTTSYLCIGNADIASASATFNVINDGTRTSSSCHVVVSDGSVAADFPRVSAAIIRIA